MSSSARSPSDVRTHEAAIGTDGVNLAPASIRRRLRALYNAACISSVKPVTSVVRLLVEGDDQCGGRVGGQDPLGAEPEIGAGGDAGEKHRGSRGIIGGHDVQVASATNP